MKISVYNADKSILDDPWKGKPFSLTKGRWTYTSSYDEAEFILGYTDYLNSSFDFNRIIHSDVYQNNTNKFVFVSMHDNTDYLYKKDESIKLNCQPMKENNDCNVITIPLHMRHFDYELQKDKQFIEECRNSKKEYDAIFIGQARYAGRQKLKIYKNDKRVKLFESSSIFNIKSVQDRVNIMKEFCRKVSKAKFSFCPRGMGTSSFRLYQSMMVGAVPIEYGQPELPFKEDIDWSNTIYKIHNTNEYTPELIDKLNSLDYEKMRNNCIKYWDQYLNMQKTDLYIIEKILR